MAPPELRGNWNRLVTVALEEFARQRRRQQFEQAMTSMSADPAIQKENAAIRSEFAIAEADGLRDH